MQESTITFTVQQLLTWILLVAAIIAVIILIVVLVKMSESMKNLSKTLDQASTLLNDVDQVVKDAKDISYDTKRTVRRVSHSVNGICKIADSKKGSIRAAGDLVNASASLASLLRK